MNQAPARLHQEKTERTNEDWIADLDRNTPIGLDAQNELRRFVHSGLGRALPNGGLDDASLEDITQDAMIRITTKLDQFRGDAKFTTWAMAIAIRVAYTALRRRRWGERSLEDMGISVDSEMTPASSSSTDPSHSVNRGDLMSVLRDAIDRDLTPRQRAVVLGELAGVPTPTLAARLDTNTNALYKLHHDARLKLRTALQQRGFSERDVRGILRGSSNP